MTTKEEFLRRFNEAFARSDIKYILDNVTDDVVWTVVGEEAVSGKAAFAEALEAMKSPEPFKLTIKNVITHGKEAAVNGTMEARDPDGKNKVYAFCDIYQFNGFKEAKIKEMTSYALEISSRS